MAHATNKTIVRAEPPPAPKDSETEKFMQAQRDILRIMANIVDACYQDDPNIAKWKPIRDAIEGLIHNAG